MPCCPALPAGLPNSEKKNSLYIWEKSNVEKKFTKKPSNCGWKCFVQAVTSSNFYFSNTLMSAKEAFRKKMPVNQTVFVKMCRPGISKLKHKKSIWRKNPDLFQGISLFKKKSSSRKKYYTVTAKVQSCERLLNFKAYFHSPYVLSNGNVVNVNWLWVSFTDNLHIIFKFFKEMIKLKNLRILVTFNL